MKYRDLDIFFRINNDTKDIRFVSGNSDIVQSIKNIVLTRVGERPFDNTFGTRVIDLLFDHPTFAELAFLQSDIKSILTSLEPRIIVDSVTIDYPYTAEDDVDIKINISYYLNNGEKNSNKQVVVLTVNQL
jgi:phage baseplate assembly protein W